MDDIETDIQADNSIVRYLLTRARQSAVEALAEMATTDPNDIARMRELQSQFNHFGDLRLWLATAIAQGQQSQAVVEGMMSTAEARELLQAAYVGGDEAQYED